MNILVLNHDGSCIVRPDTSYVKASSEYYQPDGMESLQMVPVLFTKANRACKAVPARFASRYCEDYGLGILLSPCGNIFCDHTSYLPLETYKEDALEGKAIELYFKQNASRKTIVLNDVRGTVENALVRCSVLTSLRRGDYIAAEVTEPLSVLPGDTVLLEMEGRLILEIPVIF